MADEGTTAADVVKETPPADESGGWAVKYQQDIGKKNDLITEVNGKLMDAQNRLSEFGDLDPVEVKAKLADYGTLLEKNRGADDESHDKWKTEVQTAAQAAVDEANSKVESLTSTVKTLTVKNEAQPHILKNFREDVAGDVEAMLLAATRVQDGGVVLVDGENKVLLSQDPAKVGQNMGITEWLDIYRDARPSIALSDVSGGGKAPGTNKGDVNGSNGLGFDDYMNMSKVDKAQNFTPEQRLKFAAQAVNTK